MKLDAQHLGVGVRNLPATAGPDVDCHRMFPSGGAVSPTRSRLISLMSNMTHSSRLWVLDSIFFPNVPGLDVTLAIGVPPSFTVYVRPSPVPRAPWAPPAPPGLPAARPHDHRAAGPTGPSRRVPAGGSEYRWWPYCHRHMCAQT